VDLQVRALQARLAERRLSVWLTEAARGWLAERGYDPTYGAHPLKRLIQRELADRLATMPLSGEVPEGDTVDVDATPEGLVFPGGGAGPGVGGIRGRAAQGRAPGTEPGARGSVSRGAWSGPRGQAEEPGRSGGVGRAGGLSRSETDGAGRLRV
jgi:ATP-dependent Clp protease ATP-binding subunit ClpB